MGKYNQNGKRLNVVMFQHPADKRSVDAVVAVPGLNTLLDYISKNSLERVYSFENDSSRLRITDRVSPKIIGMLEDAAQMYGVSQIPKVYLERSYQYMVDLNGMSDPHIILGTEWLENVDDQILWATLSAQIAGIQAKHGTMEFLETILGLVGGLLPFGVDTALDLALKDWRRNRAYTVDRAVLLACEDFGVAAKAILEGEAPNSVLDRIGLDKPNNSYYLQAKEFVERNGLEGGLQKVQTVMNKGQWMASRYLELYNWYYSGEYFDVLEGSLNL